MWHYVTACPAITDTDNMTLSSQDTHHGSEVTLSCNTGYAFAQEEFANEAEIIIRCDLGGKWNISRLPTCKSKHSRKCDMQSLHACTKSNSHTCTHSVSCMHTCVHSYTHSHTHTWHSIPTTCMPIGLCHTLITHWPDNIQSKDEAVSFLLLSENYGFLCFPHAIIHCCLFSSCSHLLWGTRVHWQWLHHCWLW